MFKIAKRFPDFLKIYKRLPTTTRFVYELGTLLNVDKVNRWCNKWRFSIKDAN